MFDDLSNKNTRSGDDKNAPIKSEDLIPPVNKPKEEVKAEASLAKPTEIKKKEKAGKKELADIFSDTEEKEKEKPAVFQPKTKSVSSQASSKASKNNKLHKVIIPILIIIVVIALIGGGIWAYYKFVGSINLPFLNSKVETQNSASQEDEDKTVETRHGASQPEEPIEEIEKIEKIEADKPDINKVNIPEPIVDLTDTDKDGLTDQEEIQLGTNINNVDSDNDGLFDREEVKVYKTNPLNPDSDGDTFLDGAEVKDGFDPNGPGKLYEIKK